MRRNLKKAEYKAAMRKHYSVMYALLFALAFFFAQALTHAVEKL